MNKQEARQTKDYQMAINKIKGYKKGARFKMNYQHLNISEAKLNGLKLILKDCCDEGILENVETGSTLDGLITDETFVRL